MHWQKCAHTTASSPTSIPAPSLSGGLTALVPSSSPRRRGLSSSPASTSSSSSTHQLLRVSTVPRSTRTRTSCATPTSEPCPSQPNASQSASSAVAPATPSNTDESESEVSDSDAEAGPAPAQALTLTSWTVRTPLVDCSARWRHLLTLVSAVAIQRTHSEHSLGRAGSGWAFWRLALDASRRRRRRPCPLNHPLSFQPLG